MIATTMAHPVQVHIAQSRGYFWFYHALNSWMFNLLLCWLALVGRIAAATRSSVKREVWGSFPWLVQLG